MVQSGSVESTAVCSHERQERSRDEAGCVLSSGRCCGVQLAFGVGKSKDSSLKSSENRFLRKRGQGPLERDNSS